MTELILQGKNVSQSGIGSQVGIAYYESGLICLYLADHLYLLFDRLRYEYEGHSAFLGQCYGHIVIRNCLHDCRDHRNIQHDWGLFSLSELDKRSSKRHVRGYALFCSKSWYKKILSKRMGWFVVKICHKTS